MTEFIEYMRGESEQGLRELERRQREAADRPKSADQELGYVEAAHVTTTRAVSNDTDLDNEQLLLIEAIKHDVGSSEDATVLARFAEKLGLVLPATRPASGPAIPEPAEVPMTEREKVDSIGAQVAEEVRSLLSSQGILAGRGDYGEHVKRVTNQVNKLAGVRAPECRTEDQAMSRLTAVWQLQGRVS
jgi:hypothetical protein